MNKSEFVLAALYTAGREEFSPVQVQKLFFLIDQNIADHIGGKMFNFEPYNYGPFDKNVYSELDKLQFSDFIACNSSNSVRTYRLTEEGNSKAKELFNSLDDIAKSYIERASTFVRGLNFTQLVSAIYKEYPEMRANSVFQD